jgi:hypothetical protein
MCGIPVFDVKESAPLAKHPSLTIVLYAQPLIQMTASDPLFQPIVKDRINGRTAVLLG